MSQDLCNVSVEVMTGFMQHFYAALYFGVSEQRERSLLRTFRGSLLEKLKADTFPPSHVVIACQITGTIASFASLPTPQSAARGPEAFPGRVVVTSPGNHRKP